MYYSVNCGSLGHLCNLFGQLQVAVGSCALFGQLCRYCSISSVSSSRLHDNTVSYVLLGQLCTSPSVVHYSVSCVLLSQFSQTWSVVLHSVSCMIIPSGVYYSISCALFHHLCITRRGRTRGKSPPRILGSVFFDGKVLERIHINIQTFFFG